MRERVGKRFPKRLGWILGKPLALQPDNRLDRASVLFDEPETAFDGRNQWAGDFRPLCSGLRARADAETPHQRDGGTPEEGAGVGGEQDDRGSEDDRGTGRGGAGHTEVGKRPEYPLALEPRAPVVGERRVHRIEVEVVGLRDTYGFVFPGTASASRDEPGHRFATKGDGLTSMAAEQATLGGGHDAVGYLWYGGDREFPVSHAQAPDLDLDIAFGRAPGDLFPRALRQGASDDGQVVRYSVDQEASVSHCHCRDGVRLVGGDALLEVKLFVFLITEQLPEFRQVEGFRDFVPAGKSRHDWFIELERFRVSAIFRCLTFCNVEEQGLGFSFQPHFKPT